LIAQFSDSAFTEQNAGWGMEVKVIHCSLPCVGKKRGQVSVCLMVNIVVVRRIPLNAHFCQCLAYFYRLLEKTDKNTHTVEVTIR
jgi:hypothetical protein